MTAVKFGGARISVNDPYEYVHHWGFGNVATDGLQYSSVVTIGTTAVEIFNDIIEPGVNLNNKLLDVALNTTITGLNGSFVGSLIYYWRIRPEANVLKQGVPSAFVGTYINVTGTIQNTIGTLATTDFPWVGYVPVGSVPFSPIRLSLTAVGVRAAVASAKIKNSSYVRMIGNPIPGA